MIQASSFSLFIDFFLFYLNDKYQVFKAFVNQVFTNSNQTFAPEEHKAIKAQLGEYRKLTFSVNTEEKKKEKANLAVNTKSSVPVAIQTFEQQDTEIQVCVQYSKVRNRRLGAALPDDSLAFPARRAVCFTSKRCFHALIKIKIEF